MMSVAAQACHDDDYYLCPAWRMPKKKLKTKSRRGMTQAVASEVK